MIKNFWEGTTDVWKRVWFGCYLVKILVWLWSGQGLVWLWSGQG